MGKRGHSIGLACVAQGGVLVGAEIALWRLRELEFPRCQMPDQMGGELIQACGVEDGLDVGRPRGLLAPRVSGCGGG